MITGGRKVNYAAVVEYVNAHPAMVQSEVATYFGVSQCRISRICADAGIQRLRRGRAPKPKAGQPALVAEWESILHDHGLGMDRGLRIRNQRIVYGYDPHLGVREDSSATSSTTS